jgi:hypothetical protein
MDQILAADPVLSRVADLFTQRPTPTELAERPARPAAPNRSRDRFGALRRVLATPEVIGAIALVLLGGCALLGGLLDSGAIALGGLAAPLLLGVGCYFTIKRRRRQLAPATYSAQNRRGNW